MKIGDFVKVYWRDAVQKKVNLNELIKDQSGIDFLAEKITFGVLKYNSDEVIGILHEFDPTDEESYDITFIPKKWIVSIEKI